jgi:hypothetical protein
MNQEPTSRRAVTTDARERTAPVQGVRMSMGGPQYDDHRGDAGQLQRGTHPQCAGVCQVERVLGGSLPGSRRSPPTPNGTSWGNGGKRRES